MDCWQQLGIEQTSDKREIKRAYARLLKQCNPEEHPREFQSLREAYDRALAITDYIEDELQDEEPEDVARLDPVQELDQPHPDSTRTEPGQAGNVHSERSYVNEEPHDSSSDPTPSRRERDTVRELQATRIDAAIAHVMALAQQDQAAAIASLQATLKDEFFLALDVRYEFEGQLIVALTRGAKPSFALLDYLAREFGWEINIDSPRMVVGHFDNDQRFQHAFYALAWVYVEHLAKQAMRARLQTSFPRITPDRFDELDVMLFAEDPAESLDEYCKQDRNVALLRSACQFLVSRRLITERGSIVPHKTLRWLIDHKILATSQPKPVVPHAPPEEEKSSRGSWWLIGLVCFIALRLFSSLADNSSSSYRPSSYQSKATTGQSSIEKFEANSKTPYAEIARLQREATGGDAEAQYQLGHKYTTGYQHLAQDWRQAAKWLQSAAEQGHEKAQEEAGILYYTGRGVDKDYAVAIGLLAPAAEREQCDAMYWMSRAYREGNGVKRDTSKANALLERATELGSTDGMHETGMRLITQRAKKGDLAKGEEYLRNAVEKGNEHASYQLALEYLSGKRLAANYERGYELIKSLSDKHYPLAQFWESQLLDKGIGTQKDQTRALVIKSYANRGAPPAVINDFALHMATFPNPDLRNAELAIDLMEKLLATPGFVDADRLDTLAAAYAEAGRFPDAVQAQEKAIAQFPKDGSNRERNGYEARLTLYRQGKVPRSE